ncbi:MAG: hypothetical protein Q3966_09220 [Neisseria sp.]|nr:hypothetical protein [Neisseria sp.]
MTLEIIKPRRQNLILLFDNGEDDILADFHAHITDRVSEIADSEYLLFVQSCDAFCQIKDGCLQLCDWDKCYFSQALPPDTADLPDGGEVIIINTPKGLDRQTLLEKFGQTKNMDETNQAIGGLIAQYNVYEGLLLALLTEQEKQKMEAAWAREDQG